MSESLPWFPVVGLIVGLGSVGAIAALHLMGHAGWNMGGAVLAVACSAFLTRGLHLDGLADTLDGLGGARSRQRALEIMKDSSIGTFGAIALIIVLLMKVIAVARLADQSSLSLMVVAAVMSRAVMVELAVRMPYAREKEGTGAAFVDGASPRHQRTAWVVSVALSIGVLVMSRVMLSGLGFNPFHELLEASLVCGIAFGAAFLTARMLARWYRKRVKGVTGDLLGAACEISEVIVLFFTFPLIRFIAWPVQWISLVSGEIFGG